MTTFFHNDNYFWNKQPCLAVAAPLPIFTLLYYITVSLGWLSEPVDDFDNLESEGLL